MGGKVPVGIWVCDLTCRATGPDDFPYFFLITTHTNTYTTPTHTCQHTHTHTLPTMMMTHVHSTEAPLAHALATRARAHTHILSRSPP